MDEERRVVEAVLTAGERIVAVGGLDEVRAQAAADVEFVDLQGATMTPGLVDTHPHLLHWSWTTAMQVPLWDGRNHADIVTAIRAEADKTPDGEAILCSPVGEPHFFHKRSYRDLEEAVLPDRHVLDQATSRHPVVITAWAPVRPGMMAANSLGLVGLPGMFDRKRHRSGGDQESAFGLDQALVAVRSVAVGDVVGHRLGER